MKNKIILRTISNLSFAGEMIAKELMGEKGILLKPSPESEVKIWCPIQEIKAVIFPDSKVIQGEELKNGLGF